MIAVCKMPVSFLHGEWHNKAQFFQSSMRNNKKKLHPPPPKKKIAVQRIDDIRKYSTSCYCSLCHHQTEPGDWWGKWSRSLESHWAEGKGECTWFTLFASVPARAVCLVYHPPPGSCLLTHTITASYLLWKTARTFSVKILAEQK